ncbi:response regulator, hypothetical [Salipiger mucosus DSM 16094]|uniref:Response regulator, hypothetical n=1 Tax=Salipiger mucosus DSM 16094 TaxID=1123237 RepID=S9QFJ7_9RHOB|nr:response regulator, hypothetical [Salipiger mucosus DSM 16094]
MALDLELIVQDLGFDVLGPVARIEDARRIAATETVHAAILDVRLQDGEVFPLATELQEKGVALIFHSGHALSHEIQAQYPGAKFCPKPFSTETLTRFLGALC